MEQREINNRNMFLQSLIVKPKFHSCFTIIGNYMNYYYFSVIGHACVYSKSTMRIIFVNFLQLQQQKILKMVMCQNVIQSSLLRFK